MQRDDGNREQLGDQNSIRWIGGVSVFALAAGMFAARESLSTETLLIAGLVVATTITVALLSQQVARHQHRVMAAVSALHAPLRLIEHAELFEHAADFSRGLLALSEQTDPYLREFAVMKLGSLTQEVRSLGAGEIVFTSTESWRMAYDRLLRSPGLGEYLSVAWVKSADYWRDAPGQQSLRLNYEVAARGLRIERFIILRESLWPPSERWPVCDVLKWIDEQHQHGIVISLARESALLAEPDLLCDFGIYGARAVGIHELDEQSRTLRFVLHFGRQQLAVAQDRWARLALYGEWYSVLLDGTR